MKLSSILLISALVLTWISVAPRALAMDTKQSQQQHEKEEEEEVNVPSFDECWQAIVAGVRDRDSQDEAVRLLTLGLPYRRNDEFDFYDVLDRITDENMPEALVILDRAVVALGWEVSLFVYKYNSSHERAAALGRIEIIDEMIRLWPEAFRKFPASRKHMLRWAAKFGAGKDVVNHLMNVSFVNVGWRQSDFDDVDQPLPVLRGNASTEYPKITEPEVYQGIAGALEYGDEDLLEVFLELLNYKISEDPVYDAMTYFMFDTAEYLQDIRKECAGVDEKISDEVLEEPRFFESLSGDVILLWMDDSNKTFTVPHMRVLDRMFFQEEILKVLQANEDELRDWHFQRRDGAWRAVAFYFVHTIIHPWPSTEDMFMNHIAKIAVALNAVVYALHDGDARELAREVEAEPKSSTLLSQVQGWVRGRFVQFLVEEGRIEESKYMSDVKDVMALLYVLYWALIKRPSFDEPRVQLLRALLEALQRLRTFGDGVYTEFTDIPEDSEDEGDDEADEVERGNNNVSGVAISPSMVVVAKTDSANTTEIGSD